MAFSHNAMSLESSYSTEFLYPYLFKYPLEEPKPVNLLMSDYRLKNSRCTMTGEIRGKESVSFIINEIICEDGIKHQVKGTGFLNKKLEEGYIKLPQNYTVVISLDKPFLASIPDTK